MSRRRSFAQLSIKKDGRQEIHKLQVVSFLLSKDKKKRFHDNHGKFPVYHLANPSDTGY